MVTFLEMLLSHDLPLDFFFHVPLKYVCDGFKLNLDNSKHSSIRTKGLINLDLGASVYVLQSSYLQVFSSQKIRTPCIHSVSAGSSILCG